MSNYQGGYGDLDARNRWAWCHDCNTGYRSSDRAHHFKTKHIQRPQDDWKTLPEAGEILGKSKGEMNHLVRTKRLQVERVPGARVRVWVSQASLMAYAEAEMSKGNMRLMQAVTAAAPKKAG